MVACSKKNKKWQTKKCKTVQCENGKTFKFSTRRCVKEKVTKTTTLKINNPIKCFTLLLVFLIASLIESIDSPNCISINSSVDIFSISDSGSSKLFIVFYFDTVNVQIKLFLAK